MAQDDYYYEIQLTNKQLVFYFMAGATGLILSFLAGVMVGKGVDATAGDVQAARPVLEDRVVAEEPASRATTPPPAEELTYAQRLEGERPEEAVLEPKASVAEARPAPSTLKSGSAPTLKPVPAPAKAAPTKTAPTPKPAPATTRPAPKPAAKTGPGSAKPGLHAFTIQVGAFKDKAAAESVVTRLKGKGFAAYLVTPESPGGGLYNVRVGSYPARVDAERVQAKLRDEEKFKPFIVEN